MYPSTERIEIPLNKSKLVMMLVGSLAFIAIGCWFVINPPEIKNAFWGNPTRLAVLGYAAIVFFGIVAFVLIRKLPDNKPGLIIDETGLTDNSGGLSAGHINWSDIEDVSVMEIQRQRMIMIHVRNPQEYIERQRNLFKRKGMQMNHKMYGTPISISANGLKTSFDELMDLLMRKLPQPKQSHTKL